MKRFVVFLFGFFLSAISYADICTQSQIDLGNGNCIESKFEITTTNLVANTTFAFYMSASGTFYIDWGDGNVQTITRNDLNETLYDHEYLTSGEKTIRFGGRATRYNSNKATIRFGLETSGDSGTSGTSELIASVSGRFSDIFPQISSTVPRFRNTFRIATNLVSIPADLFHGLSGCTPYMFYQTFLDTALTYIPQDLFKGISCSADNMFRSTFSNTQITSIPLGLFANIQEAQPYMFFRTFANCRNLTGYIHPSLFAGLIANNSPTADRMWEATFLNDAQLDTSCPMGTTEFDTGYKTLWGGKVSCVETTGKICNTGEYLPRYYDSCVMCPSGSACVGGTYTFNETIDQGIVACASGTFSPTGSTVCYPHILHVGDSNVYLKSTKQTTPSLNIKIGNDIFYANMTTVRTRMNKDSSHYLHVKTADNIHYYVCDDTTYTAE